MKISIAMATYNGAAYIEAQLNSFLEQTLLPDELIITDDLSTDNTVALIEQFALLAPFEVRVSTNTENLGYAGNFNAALSQTTGDLVFLSDQDDVWFPNKIEHMATLAKHNLDTMLFMNDAELTDGELNSVQLTKYGQIKSAGLKDTSFVMGCCCVIRRDFLDFTLPIPTGVKGHDNWLVNIADHLNTKYITTEILQYYRRHGKNESQILINHLTPVTLWQRKLQSFKKKIQRAFQPNFTRREKKWRHESAFLEGLYASSDKVPTRYQTAYQTFIEQKKKKVTRLKFRMEMGQLPLPKRLIKSIQVLLKKGT